MNREVAVGAMSAPIASQAMHLRLQVVQISYIYYLVTKVSYTSLQPIVGCVKRRVALMKRIMTVLAVAALMAMMLVVMAAPAMALGNG